MENEMQDLERSIRQRAYQIWTESGCQDGHAETHWLAAQREILSASLGEIDRAIMNDISGTVSKPKRAKVSRKTQHA
jgi:hypothetical protein